ncbi:ribonuclease H-like protein [Mycena crocata]|nr:ribonuclease H-like protein [Mycena crocata]
MIFIGNSHTVNEDGEHCSSGSVWYGLGDERNAVVPVGTGLASKDAGEGAAILYAIQNSPREMTLHFCMKSKRILKTLTVDLMLHEDNGWFGVKDNILLKACAAALRGRGTKCTLREADEPDKVDMQAAKELALTGLYGCEPAILHTTIPQSYDLQGVKLCTGSQASFYKAIRANKPKPDRVKTRVMLDITRHAARELSGETPTDERIWLSIRNQDITRTTREFMWKCLHQAYKIGTYWRNIPTYEHWAVCRHCDVDETMEHILLECNAPGRELLWSLAKKLWELKGYQWPEMSYGTIFACGLADVRDSRGKRDSGANRLFRILISETAHQIWKLRCTRVIQRGNDPALYHTEAELHNKWLFCINTRLKHDALLTDSRKFGRRALDIKKVQNTWKGVLKDPENLPDIWVRQSGFLVGIPPFCPSG